MNCRLLHRLSSFVLLLNHRWTTTELWRLVLPTAASRAALQVAHYTRAIDAVAAAPAAAGSAGAKLRSNRSAAHAQLGNWAEALQDATAAVQLEPSWSRAWCVHALLSDAADRARALHIRQRDECSSSLLACVLSSVTRGSAQQQRAGARTPPARRREHGAHREAMPPPQKLSFTRQRCCAYVVNDQ